MERTVRGGDLVARFGGEEFVVLLDVANIDGLRSAGERVRKAVMSAALPGGPEGLQVTISVGGCLGTPAGNLHEFESRLLATADRCLYDAKMGGRNRVVTAPIASAVGPLSAASTGLATRRVAALV
jgi:diguanylate cyclase (GGDEF)-like protein